MDGTKKPSVRVLLSTYNGELFVEELVSSILNQIDVIVELFVRDDGSSDKTSTILKNLSDSNPQIKVLTGTNIGVTASFFDLLSHESEADYFAFADQDDVWKPLKLITAIQKISKNVNNEAQMYYSKLEFVDEHLNHIGFSKDPTFSGFRNALVQNQATGCTIVLNDQARNLVISRLPTWALMHDWWCYLVVSAFGNTIYDDESHILYRKHGKNVTPATPFFAIELIARIRRYMGDGKITQKVTDQVYEFKRLFYDDLTNERKLLVDEFLNARSSNIFRRLRYVLFQQKVTRNTKLDNFILKILIVLGRF